MMSGLQPEQELKKEEFLDEDKGTSYLAKAQDLLLKQMLIH
jgi:hypothetical protein